MEKTKKKKGVKFNLDKKQTTLFNKEDIVNKIKKPTTKLI